MVSPSSRLVLLGLAIFSVLYSISTFRYLITVVSEEDKTLGGSRRQFRSENQKPSRWRIVLDKAEKNFEDHLPHLISKPPETADIQQQQDIQGLPHTLVLVLAIAGVQTIPTDASTTSAKPTVDTGQCNPMQHAEYGPVVFIGFSSSAIVCSDIGLSDFDTFPPPACSYTGYPLVWGPTNRVDSAEECCRACQNYLPGADGKKCNVWVWCGDVNMCNGTYRDCWLKKLVRAESSDASRGPNVPWTTGIFGRVELDSFQQVGAEERAYHTVITAQGTANHWQARVHYYWFLKIKKECQAKGRCQMGGFTRLLHSGEPDELMDEIPSFVVDPLPPEHPNHGYIVLNRPYAFVQWLQKATFKERYILMSEPDHIWLRPMPNMMTGEKPAAYHFFYIEPWTEANKPVTEIFTGPLTQDQVESIAPIGNAPTFISVEDMKKVAEPWMNISLAIFKNPVSNKEWGWVQEMYAFTITCYMQGVGPIDTYSKMMAQPPGQTTMDPYYLLHYTYGLDYTLEGVHMPGEYGPWRFDKRTYQDQPPPRNLGDPPKGMKNDLVRHLINAINEATNAIPGWDEYARSGIARLLWDGKFP